MKNRIPTLIIGSFLLLIFLFLLFAFQVRTTEVAVVTTFGSISGQPRTEPGLYPRLNSLALSNSAFLKGSPPKSLTG